MPRTLIFILVLFIVGLCGVDARACSCAEGSAPCQEYWRVDAVFAGTVVGSSKIDVDDGYKHTMRVIRMTVEQPIRGMTTAEVDVMTGWGGGDCGYGFKMGERYLVYAHRGKDNRLSTSICTRTRPIADAADDFAFIRGLPTASQQGVIFGIVGKRNHHWKEGEKWYKPVAKAELTVEGETAQYQGQSDEEGKFRVSNVLPGKYVVKLKLPPGFIRNSLQKDLGATTVENEVEVAAYGCAESWFILEADTRVRGRVVDANGNAVAKLPLNMRGTQQQNINTFEYATTDAEGNFEFTTVAPGDYLLGFRIMETSQAAQLPYPRTYYPGVPSKALAKTISVKEGESLPRLDLQMPAPLSQYTVHGVVVWSDGRSATGASIYVNLIEEGDMTAFWSIPTDDAGKFTLKLVKGLQYKLSAFRQITRGKGAQSEYIEAPMSEGNQPIRLVLPVQRP